MKKIISALFLISAMAVISSAQIVPPNPNCTKGHIDSPGAICQPPPQGRAGSEIGVGNQPNSDDSMLTVIKTFIAELNPFVYFLN